MRYALISDIHGNLEALQAVLDALSKEKVGGYLCIGDVVGYGADPKECIRLVRSLDPEALIAGNHEWGVLGLLSIEYFNEYAAEAILWTKGVLNKDELDYLRSFKLVHEENPLTLVHGTLEEPAEFYYLFGADEASITMNLMKTPVCFVGHTHVAGIFYLHDDEVQYTQNPARKIHPDKRYVVNPGSIGQPRDRDPRASFAVYDTESGSLDIKRVPYDIKLAQSKILKAGLPPVLAHRLAEGR